MKALVRGGTASELLARLSLLEVESSFAAGVPPASTAIAKKLGRSVPKQRSADADEKIAEWIRAALEKHLWGRIRSLRVSATEHFVILAGSCGSYYTKQLAQHVAMDGLGGRRLVNDIVVRPPK